LISEGGEKEKGEISVSLVFKIVEGKKGGAANNLHFRYSGYRGKEEKRKGNKRGREPFKKGKGKISALFRERRKKEEGRESVDFSPTSS